MTLVSVVIPAYQAADFITEAVNSVLEQRYRPLEVIIVDDASEDDTAERVEVMQEQSLAAAVPVRLVRHEANRGAAAALATGLAAAEGKLVAWLSADDVYLDPDKITRQVGELGAGFAAVFDWRFRQGSTVATSVGVTAGWPHWSGGSRSVDRGPAATLASLLFANPINGSTVLMRREAVEHLGGFDAALRNVDADADLWMRMTAAGLRLRGSYSESVFYRTHPNQTSQNLGAMSRGSALTRLRMLLTLSQIGDGRTRLRFSLPLLSAVLVNRLHRTVPAVVYALRQTCSLSPAQRLLVSAMEIDLRRKQLWDVPTFEGLIHEAEGMLDTETLRIFRQMVPA